MRKPTSYLEDPYPKLQKDLRILGFELGCEEMGGLRRPQHGKRRQEHYRMLNKLYRLTKAS